MSATPLRVDDLFENGAKAPEGELRPEAEKKVLSFPPQKGLRMQDIVLNLLLEGKHYSEISGVVGKSEEDVQKIARSEWAKREIQERLLSAKDSEKRDTLQNLVRIGAFDAVHKLGELLNCAHPPTQLGAAKVLLQYSLPVPTKLAEGEKNGAKLPGTPDEIRAEYEKLQLEIDRRNNPNAHVS